MRKVNYLWRNFSSFYTFDGTRQTVDELCLNYRDKRISVLILAIRTNMTRDQADGPRSMFTNGIVTAEVYALIYPISAPLDISIKWPSRPCRSNCLRRLFWTYFLESYPERPDGSLGTVSEYHRLYLHPKAERLQHLP